MRGGEEEKHPAAKARQRAGLQKAITGWILVVAGIVWAFQFHDSIGFVVTGVGGGILSIDNALKALGK